MKLLFGGQSIVGSMVGGIQETQELLDFCAEHGIYPDYELINSQDVNQAYERLKKGDVKFRFVIEISSLLDTRK